MGAAENLNRPHTTFNPDFRPCVGDSDHRRYLL